MYSCLPAGWEATQPNPSYHGGHQNSGILRDHCRCIHRGMQGWDVEHHTLQVHSCTSLYWHVVGEYGAEGDMSKWDVATQDLLS